MQRGVWADEAVERLATTEALDRVAVPGQRAVDVVLDDGRKDLLRGRWLGHPVHPLFVALPIGSWLNASLLDLVGGRRSAPAADLLVGFGVVAALPTAATGVADWSDTTGEARRVGLVHAAANVAALGLLTSSWVARRRGRRLRGVALALAGNAAISVGGYLGGHLAYRQGVGVDLSEALSSGAAPPPVSA
jgi:uncharacterized membrane protein